MKAISIRQPWAHLILCGEKTVECRTWQVSYRGDLLICSSANPKVVDTIPGHALIKAELIDVVPFTKEHLEPACMDEMPEGKVYAWVLSNFKMIAPFKVKGKLSLYDVNDDLIEYIDEDQDPKDAYEKYFDPYIYKGRKQK